jgi:hypothetical protein
MHSYDRARIRVAIQGMRRKEGSTKGKGERKKRENEGRLIDD